MLIRQNLVENPSFEIDVLAANPPTNWTNFNFSDLGEVVDDESMFGGKSWHVAASEAKDGGINNQDHPVAIEPGKTYTVSAYIKTALSQGQAHLHLKVFDAEYAAADEYDTDNVTDTSGWTRVSYTFTAGAGKTILEIWVACGSWGTAFIGDIWVDAIMVEEIAEAETYFDGDTAGASWDGADKLSTSTLRFEEYEGKVNEKKLWETIMATTGESAQEIVAKHLSITPVTSKSLQQMVCEAAGYGPTEKTVQQVLFENIKTACSLTEPYTKYSVQDLLQIAIDNSLTGDDLLGL